MTYVTDEAYNTFICGGTSQQEVYTAKYIVKHGFGFLQFRSAVSRLHYSQSIRLYWKVAWRLKVRRHFKFCRRDVRLRKMVKRWSPLRGVFCWKRYFSFLQQRLSPCSLAAVPHNFIGHQFIINTLQAVLNSIIKQAVHLFHYRTALYFQCTPGVFSLVFFGMMSIDFLHISRLLFTLVVAQPNTWLWINL